MHGLAIQMRLFWKEGPLIVLGDFNSHPFDEALALRTALWATRDKAELEDERDPLPDGRVGIDFYHMGQRYQDSEALSTVQTLRPFRPLYNPMWRWLVERDTHPRGTYYRKHDDAIVTWQCIDQILVSADLARRVERVDILARIGTTTLIGADRVSMDATYGDHLPVELTLGQ